MVVRAEERGYGRGVPTNGYGLWRGRGKEGDENVVELNSCDGQAIL